jgi:hypothetical protein
LAGKLKRKKKRKTKKNELVRFGGKAEAQKTRAKKNKKNRRNSLTATFQLTFLSRIF